MELESSRTRTPYDFRLGNDKPFNVWFLFRFWLDEHGWALVVARKDAGQPKMAKLRFVGIILRVPFFSFSAADGQEQPRAEDEGAKHDQEPHEQHRDANDDG